MKKITGRAIRFFLLGVLAMFVFVMVYEWEDAKRGFTDAQNGNTYKYDQKEQAQVSEQE